MDCTVLNTYQRHLKHVKYPFASNITRNYECPELDYTCSIILINLGLKITKY